MKITTQLTIDMAKRQILEKVDAVQCDANTRAVEITLTAGGNPWTPGDGLTVSVACKKPDRTSAWYDALPDGTTACSVADNVVTAILAPEVLTAAGQVKAAIVFQDESLNQLATFPFIIDVAENPAAGSAISNSYYNLQTLAQINSKINELSQNLDGLDEDVFHLRRNVSDNREQIDSNYQNITELIARTTSVFGLAQNNENRINELAATAIICTAEGESITVEDSANYTLQGLTVYGKSVQDGASIVSAGAENGELRLYIPQAFDSATIIRHPRDAAAPIGESVKLDVIAGGKGLSYQWQYSSNDGTAWNRLTSMEGAYTDTLIVPVTAGRIGLWYRCKVTDLDGNVVYSEHAVLSEGENTVYSDYAYLAEAQLSIPTPGGLRSVPVNGEDVCDCIDLMANDIERNTVKINLPTDPLKWTPVADIDGCVYYTQLEVEAASGSGVICAYLENRNPLATDDSVWSKNLIYVENNYLYISCCRDEVLTDVFLEEHENVEMEVIYARKEPLHEQLMTAEDYGAVAELHTYKPNTTIVNDAGAGMKVEYVADPKTYIDNKFAQLATVVATN